MTITAATPWRTLGPVSFETWATAIRKAGGPSALAEWECWHAAGRFSAILLNKLRAESGYGKNANRNDPAITKNPFSLRRYNADGTIDSANEDNPNGYLHFATWAEGVEAARLRITDPDAFASQTHGARNPYPATVSLADLITAFSPPAYNNTERIITESVAAINGYLKEGEPMAELTFGRVPMPPHEVRLVLNSRAWNDLGVRTIRGVVWHRMYAPLWGTDGYFRGAAADRALTDFGVGVLATDGATNDGRAFMWNDPNGRRSPWANGPVVNPRNDGKLFVDRYGINGSQRDLESIEISGNGDTALSPKARAWIVARTAYRADQYKVSHETFPLIPGEGNRSFVLWHGELNGGKWGTCPGSEIEGQTNAMIAEVKALLKKYQESTTEQYAEPSPVAAGTRIINDRLFVGVDKEYTIGRETVPRQWADPSSAATGPVLAPGAKVRVSHMVEDIGEASGLTLVLADGSRIPGLALVSA